MKTIKELEAILVDERKSAHKEGTFGLDECKKSIQFKMELHNSTIEEEYVKLIQRGLTENGFNTYMIVACEQMMEEGKRK